jgi:hypothetical protein
MDAPIMSNIIPQTRAKGVFVFFFLTSLSALGGVFLIELFVLSGLTAAAMFTLLLINLVKAFQLYRYTLTYAKRFEPLS